jgi:protein-L-isoaspartate(D-aspartate) O-methyltransferase
MTDFAQARAIMVESQLRPNRVSDPAVLDAFRAVPREAFLPEPIRAAAYADEDLPLGGGRWLMEPVVLGRLVQEATIQPTDRALVVGSASGYETAIVAGLAERVVALDCAPGFAAHAAAGVGRDVSVSAVEGPLEAGVPAEAPFDAILLAGAVPRLPAALLDQLAEGGRLVGVVQTGPGRLGQALIVERIGGALSRRVLFDAAVHALPGFPAAPAFSF